MDTQSIPTDQVMWGEVVPADRRFTTATDGYGNAVALWNGAVAYRPALVMRPTSRTEVQSAVRFARAGGLPLSVRGGGHDWAGRAHTDGGLVIDMSLMRGVDVDEPGETAWVCGGARAGDVVVATQPHGLIPATGTVGAVGIVGLSLAGGYGPLCGIAGLALDNVIEFEVVLADGSLATATADNEPDLFWALRGGGGNFGIVTAMRVRLHRIGSVVAGMLAFPWHETPAVLRAFNRLAVDAPDALTVQSGIIPGPDGTPVGFLAPTWAGDATSAAPWIDRLTGLGTPVMAQISEMPYGDLLGLFDAVAVDGRHYEMRTRTVDTLTDGVVEELTRAGERRTSPLSAIAIHHFHGWPTRVPLTHTAFGLRKAHFVIEVLAAWEPGEDATPHRAWADEVYSHLADHSLPGGYPNLIGPDQAAQADDAYGPNGPRLLDIKRRFDPEGVFRATELPHG